MDRLLQSLQDRPLLFVGGKGGVGKTTHAASLACRLAALGRKVLVVSTDPAHSLGDVLQEKLSGTARALDDNLSALELDPSRMVDEHFAAVEKTIAAYARPEMLPRLREHRRRPNPLRGLKKPPCWKPSAVMWWSSASRVSSIWSLTRHPPATRCGCWSCRR
ncbi:ArsA-related P-loop ATPase [Lautropia mirabilis]